ncbi:two-component sensor histidine kinase [Bifidobacterium adolescentis]|uniref:Sensor-like histidine kinase SenX3 n=1 Tax=Bifidobacterium adolescentis TaxID=1680 RepID=A0A6I0VC72_BIFAD|nr:two-component sensor histidine kinase [Bifidobacterium adolescentis]KAB5972365.1 two-component sensor histidine kinase [Bifidobacterium adolescentis]KAB5974844.1 two-component sensor histidine kinase [Bifidobacterium adolescentis]KAB5976246.1 two-component sensor histidine kinase [Bifidobacterium adolescentis]KAB5978123.1 two-component sensor histidine kinase [Bifidobacterium adolescentis]
MTLEQMLATPSVVAALVVVAVFVVAFLLGRRRGFQDVHVGVDPNDPSLFGAAKNTSLFGPRVPVQSTERQLVAVMPEALVVVDSLATVQYASPAARRFGIIHDRAMALAEIRDIVKLVSTDSVVRERELTIPLHGRTRTGVVNTNGKGVEAGKPLPEDTLYLHVRVGQIADNLFAIFISDMSEQRRFEIMRRDFVTNVSHELKTPAGAISLLAETIGDAADDPDAVKYFSGRISKESERLTELVHRLIDLQKAQSAAAMLNAERLSVLSVAREALAENQVKAESKHISLVLSVNGRQVLVHANAEELAKEAEQNLDVFVVADHETIKTAVKNLVENAINYSPEHTTVAVGIGIESGKVAIRVVDQGIGIPAASLSRIFERFYRVDPARSRETGGTGLGLAITKHCVEDCGGTISVWSREGEGSTFTITMPQASGATEPDHPADSANDNTREKKQSGHSTTTENEENH